MAKLRKRYSPKVWKRCCGKGCRKCEIHAAYVAEFGTVAGEKKFAKDHDRMR